MIHREEWVLNIFIQYQYPVLMDTYKKIKYNKLQTINKRIYKKLRRVKMLYRQQSKINPNIYQLIKSSIEVFNRRLFMAISQFIW